MKVFQLDREPEALRNQYGGEFGQRCLLTRRLLEAGVRFVEVSHNLNFLNGTGWDVHNDGIEQQHKLIQELDQALAALGARSGSQEKMLDKDIDRGGDGSSVVPQALMAAVDEEHHSEIVQASPWQEAAEKRGC